MKRAQEVARHAQEALMSPADSSGQSPRSSPSRRGGIVALKKHWSAVREAHVKIVQGDGTNIPIDGASALRDSKIKENLDLMVHVLVNEDRDVRRHMSSGSYEAAMASAATTTVGDFHSGPLKPCLEFVLENRVWETMCAMGLADRPPGMMALVLEKLCYMLKHIRHPLLPYKRAHMPLFQMIRVCVEVGSPRIQSSLVNLLHTVWLKMRQDPSQLQFFFSDPAKGYVAPKGQQNKLLLFTALLPFCQKQSKSGMRARDAILCVAGMGDQALSTYVATETDLCSIIEDGISTAFLSLMSCPSDPFEEDNDGVVAGTAVSETLLCVLLDRLVYCNALTLSSFVMQTNYVALELAAEKPPSTAAQEIATPVKESKKKRDKTKDVPRVVVRDIQESKEDPVTKRMVAQIRDAFLGKVLDEALRSTSENTAVRATNCLSSMLQCLGERELALESPLLRTIVRYIIGIDDESPEMKSDEDLTITLRGLLIERMNSVSPKLAKASLNLFGVLIDLNFPYVMGNLILRNLISGAHLTATSGGPPTTPGGTQSIMMNFMGEFPGSLRVGQTAAILSCLMRVCSRI